MDSRERVFRISNSSVPCIKSVRLCDILALPRKSRGDNNAPSLDCQGEVLEQCGKKNLVVAKTEATAWRRGHSRWSLTEAGRDFWRCHGLVPWSLTLVANRGGPRFWRCHGLVPWSLTLVANRGGPRFLVMPRARPVVTHVGR